MSQWLIIGNDLNWQWLIIGHFLKYVSEFSWTINYRYHKIPALLLVDASMDAHEMSKSLNFPLAQPSKRLKMNWSWDHLADQFNSQLLFFWNAKRYCTVTNISACFSHFEIKTLMWGWFGLVFEAPTRVQEHLVFKILNPILINLKTPRSCWRNKPVDDLPCFHNPSRPGPYLFSESEIIFGLGAVAKNLKHWRISKISILN